MPPLPALIEAMHEAAGAADASGAILGLNSGFERLLGYSPEARAALQGQSLEMLFEDFSSALVSEIIKKANAEGQWHGEVIFRTHERQLQSVYLVVSRLDSPTDADSPALIFVAANADEKHFNIDDLIRRQIIFGHLLRDAPLAIVAVSEEGLVVECNAVAEALWARAHAALHEGMTLREAVAPLAPIIIEAADAALTGTGARLERVPFATTPEAPIVTAEFAAYGRRRARPDSVLLFIEDRTAEIRFHEQLRETERIASFGLMSANLAHEINNPLQGLQSDLERLGRKAEVLRTEGPSQLATDIDETIAHSLEVIARLKRQLGPVLNLAHRNPPQVTRFAVMEEVRRALDLLRANRHYRDIEVTLSAADSLPDIKSDPALIGQIIANLMLNAAAAMKGHGQIQLTLSTTDTHLVLVVNDSGPGIPADVASHLFTPFFTTKPVGEGTGLGLYVSRQTAQTLGGQLELLPSAPDSLLPGATFRLTLPLTYSGPSPEAPTAPDFPFLRRSVL